MPDHDRHSTSDLRDRPGYVAPTAAERLAASKKRAEERANAYVQTPEDAEMVKFLPVYEARILARGKGSMPLAEIIGICDDLGLELLGARFRTYIVPGASQ